MRFLYFLVAENKTEKERDELDDKLSSVKERRAARPARISLLGGEVRSSDNSR